MTSFDSSSQQQNTAMSEAFEAAGVVRKETARKAAERIWKETKHNPVETMRQFDEWAQQKPERILAIVGKFWYGHVRSWLCGHDPKTWSGSRAFTGKLYRIARDKEAAYILDRYHNNKLPNSPVKEGGASIYAVRNKDYRRRKKMGLKAVRAEVDVVTNEVVNVFDTAIGPFKNIRISIGEGKTRQALLLSQATPEQALAHCDVSDSQGRFIRALCRLIPDPRSSIGAQWSPEIIREARQIAERGP